MDQELYKRKAQVIKALAHPSRLIMIDALAEGELCVCDLQHLVGADMSTVSKHLSILKSAGIVRDEKRGTMVFYKLELPCVLNFFGCVESVMKSTAKYQMELMK